MKRLQILLAGVLCHLGIASAVGQSNSFTVDAWAFDRGNARVFTEEYASAGPMVAFGGSSPVYVEYDIDFAEAGDYLLNIQYAAAESRPIELRLDGRSVGPVCRSATGSWDTSGALWEESVRLELSSGRHTFRLERANDFPHVTGLRFDALSRDSNGAVGHRRPQESYA